MEKIHQLCSKYNVKIIEDASHAIGATYQGEPVGSCRYSDIVVFSFHPVKIITSGEGGMAITNDEAIHKKLMQFRCHGIERDHNNFKHKDRPDWFFEQQELGYNYRLTDIQAALGLSQLSSLDLFITKRREIAAIYEKELADLPVTLPHQEKNQESSYHLFVLRFDRKKGSITREDAYDRLRKKSIYTNVHYIPVHLHPYYQGLGFKKGDFPVSESYFEEALSIPIFPKISNNDLEYVIENLRQLYS